MKLYKNFNVKLLNVLLMDQPQLFLNEKNDKLWLF